MGSESRGWILVLLLIAASLIAVGCGDDDEDAGSAEPSAEAPEAPAEPAAPTQKEYTAEADQICKKAKPRNEKLVEAIDSDLSELESGTSFEAQGASAKAVSDQFPELVDRRDAVTQDLEKLESPAEGPPTEYLKSRKAASKALRGTAKAYGALADEVTQEVADAAVAALGKSNELLDNSRKIAERYGFKECGQPTK